MPRGTGWAIGRPALRVAAKNLGNGSRWSVSNRGGDAGATAAMQGVKMPRVTNRMRRLARAHPEAVAAVSPSAVEDSRSKYAASAASSEVSYLNRSVANNQVENSSSCL